jgi:hypothetical protein
VQGTSRLRPLDELDTADPFAAGAPCVEPIADPTESTAASTRAIDAARELPTRDVTTRP